MLGEVANSFQLLLINEHSWLMVLFMGSGLMKDFGFLEADFEPQYKIHNRTTSIILCASDKSLDTV